MGKLGRVKTKLEKIGRQTTQRMTQKLELSLTGRAPKQAKRNGLNRGRSYYRKKKKKNNIKASGQKISRVATPQAAKDPCKRQVCRSHQTVNLIPSKNFSFFSALSIFFYRPCNTATATIFVTKKMIRRVNNPTIQIFRQFQDFRLRCTLNLVTKHKEEEQEEK